MSCVVVRLGAVWNGMDCRGSKFGVGGSSAILHQVSDHDPTKLHELLQMIYKTIIDLFKRVEDIAMWHVEQAGVGRKEASHHVTSKARPASRSALALDSSSRMARV